MIMIPIVYIVYIAEVLTISVCCLPLLNVWGKLKDDDSVGVMCLKGLIVGVVFTLLFNTIISWIASNVQFV